MASETRSGSDRGDRANDPRDRILVATNFARPLGRTLESAGVAPSLVRSALGDLLLRPRVPIAAAAQAWNAAVELSGDTRIGLRAAGRVVSGDFGLLEYLARSSHSLGAAVERIGRYHHLVNEGAEVMLLRDRPWSRVSYRGTTRLGMPRAYVEFVMALWAGVARETFGATDLDLGASFRFAAPPDAGLHRSVFGSRLAFDADATEVLVATSVLDRPVPGADPALLAALEQHAAARLAEARPQRFHRRRTEEEIRARLSDGTPRLAAVAASLGMPERTLRRHLADEGTSFAATLDDVRRELAGQLLLQGTLALAEIAFLLGFSEASAFHRAFRRWNGSSPRKQQRG